MIIADTSGLLALFNRAEPRHPKVRDAVAVADETLVVSPSALAELDCPVSTRLGVDAELAVLEEVAGGAYVLPTWDVDDTRKATEVVARYADQAVGLTDASLVVLANRDRTRRVLTLDRRRFEALRPLGGGRFRLLP